MIVKELERLLIDMNIPSHAYSVSGGLPNEAFCIGQSGDVWETYYSERGSKTSIREFGSESEACEYFLKCIKRTFKK
ncbi:MAG: hypothetical protein ACERKN_21560 [Velocimicrobium sp.]